MFPVSGYSRGYLEGMELMCCYLATERTGGGRGRGLLGDADSEPGIQRPEDGGAHQHALRSRGHHRDVGGGLRDTQAVSPVGVDHCMHHPSVSLTSLRQP